MEVIYLQHLIEYLEKYIYLKIAEVNSIFADVKSITVKPVYIDHLGDKVSAVIIDRWLL